MLLFVLMAETTETEDHKGDEMLAAGDKAALIPSQKPLAAPVQA